MAVSEDGIGALPPLKGDQARASLPDTHVWLSASAGTGKTQVLAARVFRLLLRNVDPGAILCLTFTKAGAAEMAGRINQRLAAWVRMAETALTADLNALGERATPALRERARTLFARVLDAPGGGLRIQTIHGFCQGLLAAFPIEAGFVPGFRPIEPREEALLARQALSDLLVTAQREGRGGVAETIGALSVRLGEGGAEGFLMACARAARALEALPSGLQPFVRAQLDLPMGDIGAIVLAACDDDSIDRTTLDGIAGLNREWGTKSGIARAETIATWLAASPEQRAATLDTLHLVWATASGDPRSFGKGQAPTDPAYPEMAMRMHAGCGALRAMGTRAIYADLLAAGLGVGREYARAYDAAKRRAGAVDFDDLIAATVDLLAQPGIGEWVRYKLDQATEHVLIDEAQDTNIAQWTIVRALVDEYFAGQGAHSPAARTLFTVGDYKQAIFGFQGTDPDFFGAAQRHFAAKAEAALGDARMPHDERGLPLERLSLNASFRSTRPVLQFVDAAIEALGPGALGNVGDILPHGSEVPGPGIVTLWQPIVAGAGAGGGAGAGVGAGGGAAQDEGGEEGWIDDVVRENASRIARAVKDWLDRGVMLESKGRLLRPEDVMILVKRRGDLARLIVARLYAENVPVAGVDRLRLNAPLAVQDLLATVRFVLQPDDDLNLASLLVSPLIGWSQEALMTAAVQRTGSLWQHLGRTPDARLTPLREMLARADLSTPYRFLEAILSGTLDGRRKLVRRLGEEARDPIEELLSAALDFEAVASPSLQSFLDWFDRGDVEIVRDAAAPLDAVRVMTVHGAKGLQAPVVILADATADPEKTPPSTLDWIPEGLDVRVPIFRPRSAERAGAIEAAITAAAIRERAEHWRLFYVAATRAEERLVLAGSLGAGCRGEVPKASWYAAADQALTMLGAEAGDERSFSGTAFHKPVAAKSRRVVPVMASDTLPDWAYRPAPVEARPPRPLAPSSLGEDSIAQPPPIPAMRAAAERGRLMHALFERLPAVALADRAAAADRWLRDVGQVPDPAARGAIAAAVLAVIEDPAFADLFGAQSLGEAPISAVVGDGLVVAGTVDRLLVTGDLVRVVDFKTGRQVPDDPGEIPPYHLRQMAAYAAALTAIFPDRRIEATLLYTAGPKAIILDATALAAYKPGFAAGEQSLGSGG